MVSLLQAIILGITQGITEWFPISSSGHLVLLKNIFNISQPIIYDITLHLGSLLIILLIFRKEIKQLIIGIIKKDKTQLKLLTYLIIASIPIALAGFFLNSQIKSIFNNTLTVGISLIITSIFLFLSKYPIKKNKNLTLKNTFLIGISQALALLPGVSRSGVTISTGLFQKINPKQAARFSFLLFIPAILGATVLEIKNISGITSINLLIISTLTTMIAGYFSLKLLLRIINNNKFHYFAYYCLILGLILIFL